MNEWAMSNGKVLRKWERAEMFSNHIISTHSFLLSQIEIYFSDCVAFYSSSSGSVIFKMECIACNISLWNKWSKVLELSIIFQKSSCIRPVCYFFSSTFPYVFTCAGKYVVVVQSLADVFFHYTYAFEKESKWIVATLLADAIILFETILLSTF